MASNLSNYTIQELKKKIKNQKTMAILQAFVIFLMLVFSVFSSVEKGISFQTFLPLFFIPMLYVMLFELKKMKKEVTRRIKK